MQTQHDPDTNTKKLVKNRVRVAIRVRPMINKQSTLNESSCIEYQSPNQILIGKDRCFTFDQVFSQRTSQAEVYGKCVRELVLACFQGYNGAVLAYGQTGSGKTYTMGTGISDVQDEQESGIIPRVITQIFQQIEARKQVSSTIVKISFIEIYNEQIIDLLTSPSHLLATSSNDSLRNTKHSLSKDTTNMPTIREEKDGSISLVNVVEETVTDCEQMMGLLHRGGANRSTSATLMNDCSSRSHGIFTIYIEQHPKGEMEDQGFITAKFYFVDLAGSERAKKTGASGLTLREGININLGLLQLGNVISALSASEKKEGQFITYRNSKLTRILQDSLGGNSNTYMISCISPAESNYEQSLNTIKYATKAMNIKNKPIINRDPHSAQINGLKQRILLLEGENKSLKKLLSESGISVPQEINLRNDPRTDILGEEIKKLRGKLADYQIKMESMESQLKEKSKRKNQLQIQNYELRRDRDRFKLKMEKTKTDKGLEVIQEEHEGDQELGLIEQYQSKIRNMELQLFQQQKITSHLQQQYEKLTKDTQRDQKIIMQKNKQIIKLKSLLKSMVKEQREEDAERSQMYSNSQPIGMASGDERIIRDVYEQNVGILEHGNGSQASEDEEQNQNMGQISGNEDFMEAEADFKANSNAHSQKLQQVQNQIRKQQKMLQDLTEDQINLEYQLISEMKQEYHQKIMAMQKEKEYLKKQQEEMAGYEKNPKLIQKIENLQQELRNLRKKAKDQSSLQKQVCLQGEQIKKLANEIKMHKVQKIEINRKIKQDRNAYDKFRKEKIKQILMAKKENVKKDKQIRKLALENKRKSMQMRKKVEELNKFKRINDAVKTYARNNKKHHKAVLYSEQYKGNRRFKLQSIPEPEMASDQVQKLLNKAIQSTRIQEEVRLEMDKYDNKIAELERQIERIVDERANMQMKLDRIEIYVGYNGGERSEEGQRLSASLNSLNESIENIEENITFCQHRYNQLVNDLPNFHEQADLIHNPLLNSIPKFQTVLKLIYKSLRAFISNGIINLKNVQYLTVENQELKEEINKMREQLANTINDHQINLARLREEMMIKYYNNLEEQQHWDSMAGVSGNLTKGNAGVKIDDRERKNFERKIVDLTKINRQLSADVEMWRRKCSVIQDKYHNANMRMAKDKFIGRPREQESGVKKNGGGWNIGGVNSLNSSNNTAVMIEQVNQMIQKMEKGKKGPNLSEDEQIQQFIRNSQDAEFNKNRWQCIHTLKASRSPILSMATHYNFLITSGTKSINIWDQETLQIAADLSNPNYLTGFVKSVIAIPEYSYISAACEKQVFIWDIRTYSEVAILKQHKDEVRCLYSYGHLLFSAGKGSSGSGSLFLWDLRMIRENQISLDEKERNIDIFSIASHENILYYGTRNHQVRRMLIDNREVLTPFQPPHMDTISSLTVLNNHLVSGSKDKNLKLWAFDGSLNNLKCTTHAFNDYVNTLETDKTMPFFYAGSRDGQVKIAAVADQKIKFVGGIIAHTQSVSSICSLKRSSGMFLTGSTDKTVKFWKPDPQTYERLNGNSNQDY